MTFRTRLFLASTIVTALTLGLATALVSWNLRRTVGARIERGLVDAARLASETLAHRQAATRSELDREADAIAGLISVRVTFIRADGTVVADSELTESELATVDNHADRPEVVQARADGVGVARRYSATVNADMLYVAVPVSNPQAPDLAFVRLAVPLVDVRDNLATVRHGALLAFGAGLIAALGLAWIASAVVARRVRAIAEAAEDYAAGNVSPVPREYGNDEVGTVARVLDTAIRELGQRVAESNADRARVSAILAGMIEGVIVVNQYGRLQLVNDAARHILRIPPEWQGRHYGEVIAHPQLKAHLAAALEGTARPGGEVTQLPDPQTTLMARAAPVTFPGAHGAVIVLHDISDLRRADVIRRDFVANVSHELRTPLTSIRGYVEALQDDRSVGPDTHQFLDTIARHTARMERLVQDLLRLARLEGRQEPLQPSRVDVQTLFADVAADLGDVLAPRRQHVELNVDTDAATLTADAAQLHDALRNLLENASKHAPDESRIVLGASRRGETIDLTVDDEGPGIPDADLPRVFERFYRVDKARARDGRDPGGTGLGLAIVKHIVTLHGGSVVAANRPGSGARFTISLPSPLEPHS